MKTLFEKRMFRKYRRDFRYFYDARDVKEFIKLLKEKFKGKAIYMDGKEIYINVFIDKLAGKQFLEKIGKKENG